MMHKRILCLSLAVIMALGMLGCNKAPTETTAPATITPSTQATTEATTATEEVGLQKADYARILTQEDLDTFPVATDDMSKADLRQLCQNFLLMQLNIYWKPDTNVTFLTTNYKKGTPKDLTTDTQYAGIVYHSKGFGNIYQWMEYYDEETGTLALSQFLADHGGFGEGAAVTDVETDANGNVTYQKYRSLMALGNQCTSSTCWSWGRAINSVAFGDTMDLTIANGFIPVGCYTYGYTHEGTEYGPLDIVEFGKKSDTNPLGYDTPDVIRDWIAQNGEDAMYKCYAQLKPGDLLVDEGHALMVESVNFYKTKAGEVKYDMSSITVNEQIEAWHYDGQKDGAAFKQQGGVSRSYSFETLQKDNYIPFTFPELLDENDPQDKVHLDYYYTYADQLTCITKLYPTFPEAVEVSGISIEETEVYCNYEGDTITPADFQQMIVGSNYSVSDVFVTVTDKDGNEVLKNVYRADFTSYREIPMTAQKCTWETDEDGNYLTISSGIAELANGENIITVTLRVSSGSLLTAYSGTLKAC